MQTNENMIKSLTKVASVVSGGYMVQIDVQGLAKSMASLSEILNKGNKPLLNSLPGIMEISNTLACENLGINHVQLQKLAQLEVQTAEKLSTQFPVNTVITEASVHIAELSRLVAQINNTFNLENSPISLMLKNYQSVAMRQYKEMLRPGANVVSRLAMLKAISSFVDKQVFWASDYAERLSAIQISDKRNTDEENIFEKEVVEESVVTKIPQHIGYANRHDSVITPDEALEKSQLNRILEMGKSIVGLATQINDVCSGCSKDYMFRPTSKSLMIGTNIGTIVCDEQDTFSKIVDNLYFLFYENLERIKAVVTDKEVRYNSLYSCIFAIKDFRTYYRHDYEHGNQNNIKKKSKDIRDCFVKYCGKMPIKSKDYMKLQYNLYNDILLMEERLIEVVDQSFSVTP